MKTETKIEHTPTPWEVVNNDHDEWVINGPEVRGLRGEQGKANAAFICRAVNCHEELLALTKELTVVAQDSYSPLGETLAALIYRAEKAIAKAEARP